MKLGRAIAALALLAAACGRNEPPRKPDARAMSPSGTAMAAADESRRRALEPPHGDRAIDREIVGLERAVQRDATKADLLVLLGRAWVRKAREVTDPGFYGNARAAADEALRLEPDDPGALNLEALALGNDHRFEEARGLAQRLVDAHPDDAAGLGTLSDALLELGRFDDAASAAQAMIDLKPDLPSYVRASYLRWIGGDVSGAKRMAGLAVDAGSGQRDPEPVAWALTQAATIFCHEGDYAAAEAGFERALRQMSGYPPALVGEARVAMARGEPRAAAELLTEAYQASPLVETAWLLGDAWSMAGEAVAAQDAYARVERGGARTDRRTLALFWATKNLHAAEALALAEAEKSVRGDLYTDDAYAWALYRAGELARAQDASDRALYQGTRDARLLYHAGAIRLARGDVRGGRRLVTEALALEPAFDWTGASEARALLDHGPR